MFWPNYWARLFGFLILGVTALKNAICYVWLFDLAESKHRQVMCGFATGLDLTTIPVMTIYLIYINKSWYGICLFMTLLSLLAFFCAITVLPESPIWLLLQGRREDAIKAFNWIAKINGSKNRIPENAFFEESNLV